MSVFVPNQWATLPSSSRTGMTLVRNGRKLPSAPRSGNTMSNGSPLAIDPCHRPSTLGSRSGSWTFRHPQPSISSGVVPV